MSRLIPQIIDELDTSDSLSSKYAPLVAYYNEFGSIGNIKTPDVYNYEGKSIKIGRLVILLKMQYKKGLLDESTIEFLNNMGMIWSYDKLAPLGAYYQEFGTIANIKHADTYNYNGTEVNIGLLISNLRRPERQAKLTQEEIDWLNSMGMAWGAEKEDRLASLRAYYKEYGTLANIKSDDTFIYNGEEIKIGGLIRRLRTEYNKGKLNKEIVIKLEQMGMIWRVEYDRLEVVRAYYKEFGTIANISSSQVYAYKGKNFKIGSLINHLRVEYKDGCLSQETIVELEKMGMVWVVRNMIKFKDRLEPLVAYYNEYGTISTIRSEEIYTYQGQNVNIGILIVNLRAEYKQGKLSEDIIKLLNNMGMMWSKRKEYDRLDLLSTYCQEFGTIANIKKQDVYTYQGEEMNIGILISGLRAYYKKGKLSKEEIEILNSMGMIWDATLRKGDKSKQDSNINNNLNI